MRASVIAMLLLPPLAWASDDRSDAELAAEAARAFQQGVESKAHFLEARKHFARAADHWLDLHRRGVRSAALYRNLGNAAALADRWPEAIWAYHMGLNLDPNDLAMRDHLAFARAKTLYPASGIGMPEADAWPAWLFRPNLAAWSMLAASAYALTWIVGTIAFLRRTPRLYLATTLALGATLAFGLGAWHACDQATIDHATPLVIVADNTPFLRGNGPSYPRQPDVPILPRGMEVRQIHRRGDWVMVRLTSGEVGWLPVERALIVAVE